MSLQEQLQQAAFALRVIAERGDREHFERLADAVDEARKILAALDTAMRPRAVEATTPFDQEADPLTDMSRMDYEADEHD